MVVNINVEARIVLVVRAREGDENISRCRCGVASSDNLDLCALWVGLSRHRVEGDGLEANQVLAWWDRRGNNCRPSRVLRNHDARCPCAAIDSAINETGFLNLEPLCSGGIDIRAS